MGLLGQCVGTATMKESKKNTFFCLTLSESLGLEVRTWKHERGQDTRDNRHVRQREVLRCDVGGNFIWELRAVERHTPSAVRCTAPSWTSEVRMPELAACQSAQVQAVLARQAPGGRLRHRPIPSAMAHTSKPSSAGSGVMCLAKISSRAWSVAASVTASRNSSSLWARMRSQPVVHAWFWSQRSMTRATCHSGTITVAAIALFVTMSMSSNEPSSTERVSVASSSLDSSAMAHRIFGSGLWFDLFREQVASGVQLVGLCNSPAEIVVAACAQLTPPTARDTSSSKEDADIN